MGCAWFLRSLYLCWEHRSLLDAFVNAFEPCSRLFVLHNCGMFPYPRRYADRSVLGDWLDRFGGRFLVSGEWMITTSFIGSDIKVLKAYSWKVQCPPKLRHFLWQILARCVPVTDNLRKRDINCEIGCSICGALEETMDNLVYLESKD